MKYFVLCATSILLLCSSSSVFAEEFIRTDMDAVGSESLSVIFRQKSKLTQNPAPAPAPEPVKGCWSTTDQKMIQVGKKDSSGRICQSNGTFK